VSCRTATIKRIADTILGALVRALPDRMPAASSGTLLVMAFGAFYLWRGSVFRRPSWLKLAVLATPLPIIAIQLGWATAEVGRQPWVVYGVMRTADGVSRAVPAEQVALSLGLLVGVYTLLGGVWLFVVRRELGHGPAPAPEGTDEATMDELPAPAPRMQPGQTAAQGG
jgi:cytochrome bd-type quinol oxidase subunit 1